MSIRVAGQSFAKPSEIKLYDQVLAASGRFDVTGIPPGYNLLRGILTGETDVAADFDFIRVFFNGDETATNYRRGSFEAGTGTGSSVADDPNAGVIAGATSPANYIGFIDFNIYSYAGSDNKMYFSHAGNRRTTVTISLYNFFFQWENTAAINQLTIQPDGFATDEFIAGSRLQLWLSR